MRVRVIALVLVVIAGVAAAFVVGEVDSTADAWLVAAIGLALAAVTAFAISNAGTRHSRALLADEQAALRRVATLIARDSSPEEICTAVSEAVGSVLGVDVSAIVAFPDDVAGVVVASWSCEGSPVPIGTRMPLDIDTVTAQIFHSGAAARIDAYPSTGPGRDSARSVGVRSSVGAPILVEGKLWGAVLAAIRGDRSLPDDAEQRIAAFTELVATAISNADAHRDLQRLADEQAALRRVATLVAAQAAPDDIHAAVAEEVALLLGAHRCAVGRYEPGETLTVTGYWSMDGTELAVGTRIPLEGDVVTATVRQSGRPIRIDTFDDLSGPVVEYAREVGPLPPSTVGAPIVVHGKPWGIIFVSSMTDPLPGDAESRVVLFTELVATAIANADSRSALHELAEEQAALRRVAELVSHDAAAAKVFEAVAAEAGELLGADMTVVGRYNDGAATAIGSWSSRSSPPAVPVGTRSSIGGRTLLSAVAESGTAARVDDYELATGEAAEFARRYGWRSSVAAPITVEDRVWGVMLVATQREQPFPVGAERRLAQFTDLLATAVANADARAAVQTAAQEQGALRRVATLVAGSAAPSEVFASVTREIALVLGADTTLLCRADPDGVAVVVGTWSDGTAPAIGTRIPRGGTNLTTIVLDTGRPARIESYDDATGHGSEVARSHGLRSAVGAPILVEGGLWGLVIAGARADEPLAPDAEERLAAFTELVATAIANAQAHGDLTSLLEQQAALRRVATLVARRVVPEAVFRAVAEEAGALLGADLSALVRLESDDTVTVVAGPPPGPHAAGERVMIDPSFVVHAVRETGRPARFETGDLTAGGMPDLVRRLGVRSAVATPIVVEGALWGAVVLGSFRASLAPETEQRLDEFTELVATGISNATARSELVASRARIVAAGDGARRRIERNLHDGTQQRLVSLGLAVRAAEANLPPEADDLRSQLSGVAMGLVAAVEELQEISRGIHPAILSKGGLGPALRALAHRSAIPVRLDIRTDGRLAEPIEVAGYFVASEALANAAKHSQAARIDISLTQRDGRLLLSVCDDGVGGADPGHGSGLVGLADRVEAIGGVLSVHTRDGAGTEVAAELPMTPP